jgi:DNA polymerase-1
MNDENERLLLVDGHALIHRAYHAMPELTTSSGELINAVLGVANILFKEIDELQPSHVIMAFDRPAPTFRHQAYAEYKATRARTPEPLISQFQRVRQLAAAMNIPIVEIDGFEADDVLGTLARQAEKRGLETVIVTGDLDALQLVSDSVHVLTPGRGIAETTLYDCDRVRGRYGIEPNQLPDWKALVGDTSDNIPGVSGIGAKTASELIAKYGDLESIYEHLDEIPARRRDALEQGRDQAFESRGLARIVRDAPVALQLDGAHRRDVDRSELINLLRELEFRQLLDRMQRTVPPAPAPSPVADGTSPQQLTMFSDLPGSGAGRQTALTTVLAPAAFTSASETRLVRTDADLEDLAAELGRTARFAVDTETTSTDPLRARLVGLSFATEPQKAWYVPVGHAEGDQLPLVRVLDRLRPLLEADTPAKAGHNIKYDYAVLATHGVALTGVEFDTMIAAYLVNPNTRGLSLSSLALARLNVEMTPIEALIGKGKTQITMDLVDIETVARYAGDDAAVVVRLVDDLAHELRERGQEDLFHDVEMPLVPVLADMETVGVCLDTDVLAQMSREMTEAIGDLEGRIYDLAGHRFNINSTQQLGQVLFVELKLPSGRKTKTGFSTDSEVLEALRDRHEIVNDILEYRQLIKLKNTYVDALPSLINPETGRVHTDFNQTIAATGRLSSSNPNLQNIPIRGELGRKIRRAFIPTAKNHVLLAADYSQIELRILASMSGDERLMQAFLAGEDIHRATAANVFNVPLDEVTPDQRRIAKVVNFGIIYGIGEQRLAHETGISRQEAGEFITNYNQTYAGVKEFMDRLRRQAFMVGWVETLMHRRRYTPEIRSDHPGVRASAERAAINMPIQGTAADIIKVAMIRLHESLPKRFPGTSMVLQVHDELVFDVPEKQAAEVAGHVRETMEHAIQLKVPLEVEVKVGKDWYDMSPVGAT